MTGRTIVIGDIHGCYDELSELLEKVALGRGDRVVAVGDLLVKGEKNRAVLDLFMTDERFSSVLGNHDRAILRYWAGETPALKKKQAKAAAELKAGRARYAAYLQALPVQLDLGSHLVVHAGVRPGVAFDAQSIEDLTELRTLGSDRTNREGIPWYEIYNGEKIVLFGHWPASPPRRGPRAIGLDTGCVYGYDLTAYIIESDQIVSVKARRAYDVPNDPGTIAELLQHSKKLALKPFRKMRKAQS
jgi:diadenosine tetraphosphatase ApaH/serine/threonine PP2A family protein phosphatase